MHALSRAPSVSTLSVLTLTILCNCYISVIFAINILKHFALFDALQTICSSYYPLSFGRHYSNISESNVVRHKLDCLISTVTVKSP